MPLSPDLLAVAFLAVMAAAVGCFFRAYALRAAKPRHLRWAIAGLSIDVLGTVVVFVTQRLLHWRVEPRFPDVATVHRVLAYVVTGLLFVQAWSGATRRPWHGRAGAVFLPLYTATYLLAVWAYAPWW